MNLLRRFHFDRLAGPALAALCTFLFLGAKSLSLDEVTSINFSRGWNQLWNVMLHEETNMWLYYIALHVWLKLGDSEFLVRSLSAISATASVAVFYALVRRLFDARVALLASMLLATNSYFVRYAQDARSYALFLILLFASTYFFIRATQSSFRRFWIGHALCTSLSVYAHLFGVLVLPVQLVSLALLPYEAKRIRAFFLSCLAIGVTLTPFLFVSVKPELIGWVEPVTLRDIFYLFLKYSGHRLELLALYFVFCTLAIVLIFKKVSPVKRSVPLWRYTYPLLWLLIPIVITIIYSLLVRPVFVRRYLLITLPALTLLAALGLASTRRYIFWGLTIGVFFFNTISLRDYYLKSRKQDWREVTAYALKHAQPDDAVLFFSYIGQKPFEYYVPRLTAPQGIPQQLELASTPYAPGGSGVLPPPNKELIERLPLKHPRVWLILFHEKLFRFGHDKRSEQIRNLMKVDYQLVEEKPFSEIRIQRYDRKPR